MNHHILKQIIKSLVKEQYFIKKTQGTKGIGPRLTLLLEARIDDVKSKYPEMANYIDMFSGQEYQKYIFWIAKQLKIKYDLYSSQQPRAILNTVEIIKKSILAFDKGIKLGWITNSDIESYKKLEDLENAVEDLPQYSKTELKKQAKKSSKLIFKNDRFTIVKPESMEASCYYGFGTKWCISATQSENYYKSYADRGIEFYFIMDKLPTEKVFNKLAVAVYPDNKNVEFFDALDNEVSIKEFIEYYPEEVINVLTPFVKKLNTVQKRSEQFLKSTEGMDGLAFKKHLTDFYDIFSQSDYMENDEYTVMMRKIIDKISLPLLPYLYYPDTKGSLTLNNIDVLADFVDRITKENLSIEQVLDMAKISHQTYNPKQDYWADFDPYYAYFENLDTATIEDIKKLSLTNTNPEIFKKPPFYQAATTLYLINIAPSLGIKVINKSGLIDTQSYEFIALRNFALGGRTNEFIKNLAEALKTQNKEAIAKLSRENNESSSIPFSVMKKIADLYSSGVLTSEILAPITANQ